jgi:hypothetical protein
VEGCGVTDTLPAAWRFTVPGVPRGQGRPRFARIGAFVLTDFRKPDSVNV